MDPIPYPKKQQHQAFADLVLAGHAPAAAYQMAGFVAKTAQSRATCASRLLKNVDIAQYLGTKRRAMEKVSDIDKSEAVMMAVNILRSKPCEASLENPLCEIRYSAEGPVAVFPSKSKMMDRLAKMLGWDAPTKVEVDGLQELAEAFGQLGAKAGALPEDKM